jgi:hypothetical protein
MRAAFSASTTRNAFIHILKIMFIAVILLFIPGDSRVILNPMELKMQPTIHLERKAGYRCGKYPALPSKCIVGCIFNFVGVIITRESPCVFVKTLLSVVGRVSM